MKDGRLAAEKVYGRTVLRQEAVAAYERTLGVRNGYLKRGKVSAARPKRNIMELRGLGKEVWAGVDAKQYVNDLRDEWSGAQVTRLEDALRGVTRVGVDTMTVIYFVEEKPAYLPVVDAVFQRISRGELTGAASTITLTEVLIQPLPSGRRTPGRPIPGAADQQQQL